MIDLILLEKIIEIAEERGRLRVYLNKYKKGSKNWIETNNDYNKISLELQQLQNDIIK